MSLDIDRCEAHQNEQRQHAIEQFPILTAPSQDHEDGGHTDMTTGEGCCRLFARFVGAGHALIEKAFGIARNRECLIVGCKIVADVGECAIRNVVEACSQIIILWTCNGQEDENDVIDKERREDDKLK